MKHKIIREYVKGLRDFRAIVRTADVMIDMADLDELFAAAQSDFPGLEKDDAMIVHYGGENYKGTWGLEFFVSEKPPATYTERQQPETLLG